jgi:hypothetical protein
VAQARQCATAELARGARPLRMGMLGNGLSAWGARAHLSSVVLEALPARFGRARVGALGEAPT